MYKRPEDNVVHRFFANTCTYEERKQVEEFLYEDDEFRKAFLELENELRSFGSG